MDGEGDLRVEGRQPASGASVPCPRLRPTAGAVSPTLLSPEQVARRWGVSAVSVQRWCARGELAAAKIGRQWRISEEAVAEFERGGQLANESPGPTTPDDEFGSLLRAAREKKGWSQRQLGNMLAPSVGVDQISRYERGRNRPYPARLEQLIRLLELPKLEAMRLAAVPARTAKAAPPTSCSAEKRAGKTLRRLRETHPPFEEVAGPERVGKAP